MSSKTNEPFRTASELRRAIAEKRYDWTVDSRLRDADPLPSYPRGGKPEDSPGLKHTVREDLADFLRKHPPSNPLVRARWMELNLLPSDSPSVLSGPLPGIVAPPTLALTVARPVEGQQVSVGVDFPVSGIAQGSGGAEPHTIDAVTVQLDNQAPANATLSTPSQPLPLGVVFDATLRVTVTGAHVVKVTATDDIGRTGSKIINISAPPIDWRNRFGTNWISSVRDQRPCQSCWAFAMTALYEAMVRIEHCVWCRRSEGEVVRGVGKQCWDIGNFGEAATFVQNYGLADPDCFPWSDAASIYSAREGKGAWPLSPTPDRPGRIVHVPTAVALTDPAQKKQWIDTVGPMAVMFDLPADFDAYGGGVYIPTTNVTRGLHALLVVGFDDSRQCWIVKNSWGATWGMGGFALIGYSANLLEPHEFWGVRGVSPDPWTKRRLRNGVLVQSTNGAAHNNFELFVQIGATLEQWSRDNATPGLPWSRVGIVRSSDPWRDSFHDDAVDCPAVVQSTFNGNYELVYRTDPAGPGGGRLRHVYFDQFSRDWFDATIFGPPDPVGVPGFIQSSRGAPGDFEVVILRQSGILEHWTKHNSWPWTHLPGTWYFREQVGSNISFAGPGLVQSRLGVTGALEAGQGELHYVCTGADGQMRHFKLTPSGWQLVSAFGNGIATAPVMIEGQVRAKDELDVGNFELCVASNGQIQHWSRDNHTGGAWAQTATFGQGVSRVVGLLEGSFGFELEVIAERTDGHYQHFTRGAGGWQQGSIIV